MHNNGLIAIVAAGAWVAQKMDIISKATADEATITMICIVAFIMLQRVEARADETARSLEKAREQIADIHFEMNKRPKI